MVLVMVVMVLDTLDLDGHVLYGKREAEPKADAEPWLSYGYGLGYGGYGLGYTGLGYGHVLYGKREAEPKAAADPWLYGGYGLGYGYSRLGYSGLYGWGR